MFSLIGKPGPGPIPVGAGCGGSCRACETIVTKNNTTAKNGLLIILFIVCKNK